MSPPKSHSHEKPLCLALGSRRRNPMAAVLRARYVRCIRWGLEMLASHVCYMGGCRNYAPFFCPYYNAVPIIWGTQKGTLMWTTTHMLVYVGT